MFFMKYLGFVYAVKKNHGKKVIIVFEPFNWVYITEI
jgi:hypothetical protein